MFGNQKGFWKNHLDKSFGRVNRKARPGKQSRPKSVLEKQWNLLDQKINRTFRTTYTTFLIINQVITRHVRGEKMSSWTDTLAKRN